MASKNLAFVSKECVACGNCIKACPKSAMYILKGMYAVPDPALCIGCGKCMKSCPADVITIQLRGGNHHE